MQKLKTVHTPPRIDRRVRRTRDRLNWSMVELIREKGYDNTTVQDVVARADVSRSTFYAHFTDKDDVFVQHFIGFIRALGHTLEWDAPECGFSSVVLDFITHVGGNQVLYVELSKAGRLDSTFKLGQVVLSETLLPRVAAAARAADALPPDIVAQHIASTLFSLLTWWMDHHQPCTAEELARTFHRLVRGV